MRRRLSAGRPADAMTDLEEALELNAAIEQTPRPLIERAEHGLDCCSPYRSESV